MKFASYIKNGNHSYGVVKDDGVIDLGGLLGGQFADLKSLLAGGMEEAAAFAQDSPVDTKLEDVQLLPVIPNPGVVWAAGMNTHSHYV